MAAGLLGILKQVAAFTSKKSALLTKNSSKIVSASIKSAKGVAAASPDDIAVRATKIGEASADREITIFMKIFLIALFVNRPLVLFAIFALNYYAPWSILPLLGAAGAFLAYEAFHVIHEFYEHKIKGVKSEKTDEIVSENQMVFSTLISDFILSLELTVIALNPIMGEAVEVHVTSVTLVIFFATIIVYLLVLLMLRLDNFALWLIKSGRLVSLGEKILSFVPWIMKFITFVGTVAMVLLAGEIALHFHIVHEFYVDYFHIVPELLFEVLLGLVGGCFIFYLVKVFKYPFKKNQTIKTS